MTTNDLITMMVQMILIPLAMWGILIVRNYLLSKIENEKVKQIFILADEAVRAAVGEAGQTFVDEIKSSGQMLTTEEAEKAAKMAFYRAVQILGVDGVAILERATGDINSYISAKIEEEVRRTKIPADSQAELGINAIGFKLDEEINKDAA